MREEKQKRRDVNGWIILDKPAGITSTQAVAKIRWLFNARKAGHAGTLDPLASGLLPIALGEATKTVPYVQDGEKAYRFTISWGSETDTDDSEGQTTRTSDLRVATEAISAILPQYIGQIEQLPPRYSALRIDGARAYDLARRGKEFELASRKVDIYDLRLVETAEDFAVFEIECGKGTYVRALARDIGRHLGCFGHVIALRRLRVGPMYIRESVSLSAFEEGACPIYSFLHPVETGLSEIPCFPIDSTLSGRVRRGQSVILRGQSMPLEGPAYASCQGVAVALGRVKSGEFHPLRIFNLPLC